KASEARPLFDRRLGVSCFARRLPVGRRSGRDSVGGRPGRGSLGALVAVLLCSQRGFLASGYSAVVTSHVEPSWLRPRFSIRIRLTAAAPWASQILFFFFPMYG